MQISLIVAKSRNNVIGKNNQLPWYLPADLKHFKALTIGKPIIMGRKTFESIGKPLPNRKNMIITHQKNLLISGCDVFNSIDDALSAAKNEPEVMIIGGANLYAQILPHAHCVYLTVIDAEFEGDAFFPALNHRWKVISETKCMMDEKNKYAYQFQTWIKI